MAAETDRGIRPFRMPGRALAAFLLTAFATGSLEEAAAQTRPIEKMQEQRPVPPETTTPEIPVHLPPFPRGEELVELDSTSFEEGVRVFLDPASLSQPAPELVRYTMLLVSAKGAGNLFFESIDCGREEWRSLAFGTREGTFEPIRSPRWRTLRAGANAGFRRVIAREFVCILNRRIPDRAEDLRRRLLRQGVTASVGPTARGNR